MRQILSIIFVFSALALNAQQVSVDKLPATVDEFITFRNNIATTPEGGATVFLTALKIYVENEELGKQCLVISVDQGSLKEGETYKGFSLLDGDMQLIKSQMEKDKNIPNSYIKGSSTENAYKVKLPYVYEYKSNTYSGDKVNGPFKIYVKSSGADSPRPLSLKPNDKGIWKVTVWSSVLVGIKKLPVSDNL